MSSRPVLCDLRVVSPFASPPSNWAVCYFEKERRSSFPSTKVGSGESNGFRLDNTAGSVSFRGEGSFC